MGRRTGIGMLTVQAFSRMLSACELHGELVNWMNIKLIPTVGSVRTLSKSILEMVISMLWILHDNCGVDGYIEANEVIDEWMTKIIGWNVSLVFVKSSPAVMVEGCHHLPYLLCLKHMDVVKTQLYQNWSDLMCKLTSQTFFQCRW